MVDEEPVMESETREDGNVENLLNNVSGNITSGKLFLYTWRNCLYYFKYHVAEEEDEEENASDQYSTVVETDFKFSEFVYR